jgi:two-component system OmpR family response regulator
MPQVLIVEPYRDARELYELALGLHGVRVTTAATGAEAMAIAREADLQVILMELRLPDADGLELASRLGRASDGTVPPQVVAMSADLTHFSEELALRAGCAAFLPKPCLLDTVVSEVRQSLR